MPGAAPQAAHSSTPTGNSPHVGMTQQLCVSGEGISRPQGRPEAARPIPQPAHPVVAGKSPSHPLCVGKVLWAAGVAGRRSGHRAA